MNVFDEPKAIIEHLKANGYEAFFVGGSVRDYILNRTIGDIDITTSATPDEVMALFPKHVPVGIQHGTVLVIHKGTGYEVTTYRAESDYENFRAPKEVQFVKNLDEDLKRRDFTMNAIAMNEAFDIYDPYNGKEDIKKQVIVTVGRASERFSEDALRMLRAVRFMSVLGFSLAETTEAAIKEHVSLLEHISVERKLAEFDKLLVGKKANVAIQKIIDTKMNEYLPGLEKKEAVLNQFVIDCTNVSEADLPMMWAILCYRLEADCIAFCKQWKMSTKRMKEIAVIEKMVRELLVKKKWHREDIFKVGYDYCKAAESIVSALSICTVSNSLEEEYTNMKIKSRQELAVTGTHLQKWTRKKPGPWIQETLDEIISKVLYGLLENEEETIKEWLLCNHN